MFRNFLLTALRNLWRNKIHSLINIASLALGLTVFAFAFLYVKKEFSYDRSWPDAERIHRLTLEQHGLPGSADGSFNSVVARAWPSITEYFAEEIDSATRINRVSARLDGTEVQNYRQLGFADPGFTDIFQYELAQGSLEKVFAEPGYVALEEGYAATLGSSGEPGAIIMLESGVGGKVSYEVAAIYRQPKNISSSLDFQLLTLIHDYSLPFLKSPDNTFFSPAWENSSEVWLTLKPGIDTAAFNAMQPVFIDKVVTAYDKALGPDSKISDHLSYTWQKITDMHFNPVSSENFSNGSAGNLNRVLTFAVVGILILLVGCSNSVSLSLVAALERRREIGVRKAIGAVQRDIMVQHLGESVLFALLALIPAILMFELLQPAFIRMLPFSMRTLDAGLTDYLLMVLIAVLTGLGSGYYPSLALSSVKPEAALKPGSVSRKKSGQRLRAVLVACQFCLASMLLIGTGALYVQLAITRSQPVGYSADNLIAVMLANEQRPAGSALLEEFKRMPGVIQALPASMLPNQNMPLNLNSTTYVRKNEEISEAKLQMVYANEGLLEMFDIPLLAGRYYDKNRDSFNPETQSFGDQPSGAGQPRIFNRSGIRALGFSSAEEAIDQVVYWKPPSYTPGEVREIPIRIIGVVEDNMLSSLHRRPGPESYMLTDSPVVALIYLEYEEAVEKDILERVRQFALDTTGYAPGNTIFLETILERAFIQEQNESRLLLICGALALLLASIGLYGLASFAMERNVKEVGVRKVLGSTVSSIMALFVWRFSRPVLLANLLAWPVAAYFVLEWIKQFPYQLEKIWLLPLCLGTAVLVLLIAILTVSVITARTAVAKPVQSLRYE